jgi:hypothetical protein
MPVEDLGNWQANTQRKAAFILAMLENSLFDPKL